MRKIPTNESQGLGMNNTSADQKAVASTLKCIIAACKNGNVKELKKYFHSSMVIEGPEFQERKEGLDQCLQHHEDFLRNVHIQSYKESDHQVRVWGDTAVANYRFEVQIETDGQVYRDIGRELYVFSRMNGEWRAVWNSIVPSSFGQ